MITANSLCILPGVEGNANGNRKVERKLWHCLQDEMLGGEICLQMKANFILLYFFLVPKVSQVKETLNTPGYFKSRKKALSTQEPEAVPISWSHKYTSWTVSSIQASPTEWSHMNKENIFRETLRHWEWLWYANERRLEEAILSSTCWGTPPACHAMWRVNGLLKSCCSNSILHKSFAGRACG